MTKQSWFSYSLTRRHTTTDHRRERGGSERELGYGVDAGRRAFSVNLCPYLHVTSMNACTSVALTCSSATGRTLSTGISIPARQKQQHGGFRLARSMFRGLFERSEFLILVLVGNVLCTRYVCTTLYDTRYVLCTCLLYTSPSPRDRQKSRMPSSA